MLLKLVFVLTAAAHCILGAAAGPVRVSGSRLEHYRPKQTGTHSQPQNPTRAPAAASTPQIERRYAKKDVAVMTMTIQNKADTDMLLDFIVGKDETGHEFNHVIGNPATVTLPSNGATEHLLPGDWNGVISVGAGISADNSLIESNTHKGMFDVDVSYVQGYSVSIVCHCDGVVVTGCNQDLWALNNCPNKESGNVCSNKVRSSDAKQAAPFFQPCQGAAITYPTDGGNAFDVCRAPNQVTCCIGGPGNPCPQNPRQH